MIGSRISGSAVEMVAMTMKIRTTAWSFCGNGGDDDGDEEGNSLELLFGGAKASLNLNQFKKKWLFE